MSGACTRPQAIVLACWPGEDGLLQGLNLDPGTMMLGDKVMAQRVLERLVDLGCRDIGVVLGDQPQRVRALLGNGERWGCRIQYCYAAAGDRPLQVLARWRPPQGERSLIAVADTVVWCEIDRNSSAAACSMDGGNISWSGWACLSSDEFAQLVLKASGRVALERRILGASSLRRVWEEAPLSTAGASRMLDSVAQMFARSPGLAGIMRRPSGAAVWIGNGSRVHPGAQLIAPVYIGDYVRIEDGARIGPNAVIGDGCLVDQGVVVESSLVAPATYVGRGLEMVRVVAAPNGIANVRLESVIGVSDKNLIDGLGGAAAATPRTPISQRLLAAAIWAAAWPFARALRKRAQSGAAAVARFDAARGSFVASDVRLEAAHEAVYAGRNGAWLQHFLRTFHPGLRDVVAGRLALVGMQPRSLEQAHALPEHWRRLYAGGVIGLVNEALLLGRDGCSADMRYAGDALAAGTLPLRRNLTLLAQYAQRVMREARSGIASRAVVGRDALSARAQDCGIATSAVPTLFK